MLDAILRVVVFFDFVTPLVAALQDLINWPVATFYLPEDCGYSANSLARLLRSRGIKVWGVMVHKREIRLTVRREQAKWADHVLSHGDASPEQEPSAAPVRTRAPNPSLPHPRRRGALSQVFDELLATVRSIW